MKFNTKLMSSEYLGELKMQTLVQFQKIYGKQGSYNFICECTPDPHRKIILAFDEKNPTKNPYCLLLVNR